MPLPKLSDIFFEARPVYLHRKGEGSLLLSEFECPRTILIKEQQQHIFFIKKLKKKLPSTLACVAGGIRELKQQTFSAQRRQPEVTFTSDSRFPPLWLAVATRRQRHIACFAVVSKT